MADGIQCNACNEWAHQECTGTSSEIYALYKRYTELEWVCGLCMEAAKAQRGLVVPTPKPRKAVPPSHTGGDCPVVATAQPSTYAEAVLKPPMQTAPPEKPKSKKRVRKGKGQKPKEQSTAKELPGNAIPGYKTLESMIQKLATEVSKLQATKGNAKVQQKTLLILNREEPQILESKTRRDLDKRRIMDILRMAGLHPNTPLKRVHRVGVWKKPNPFGAQNARPILVEFIDSGPRDALLARASLVNQLSKGRYKLIEDNPRHTKMSKFQSSYVGQNRYPRSSSATPYERNGVVIIEDVMEAGDFQLYPQLRPECTIDICNEDATPFRPISLHDAPDTDFRSCGATPSTVQSSAPKNGTLSRVLRPRK